MQYMIQMILIETNNYLKVITEIRIIIMRKTGMESDQIIKKIRIVADVASVFAESLERRKLYWAEQLHTGIVL